MDLAYKGDLYLKAFRNTIKKYSENPEVEKRKDVIKSAVFYGVKLINADMNRGAISKDGAIARFQLISLIKDMVGLLTPKEFMEVFPIEKDFKGHKWDMKDYFYTRDYIESIGFNKDIGVGDSALMFLWEYTNRDVEMFNMCSMRALSDLREYEGHPSMAKEWADINGLETYTLHTDSRGQDFLLGKDGKTRKVLKNRPRHLKLVQ